MQPAIKINIFASLAIVPDTPECRIDRDCPSKLACISEICQNPCSVNNPCSNTQKCVVIDSQPSRSVACICPEGAVFGSNGACTQGNIVCKLNSVFSPTISKNNNFTMHIYLFNKSHLTKNTCNIVLNFVQSLILILFLVHS